jgi:hypothetical protein
VRKFSANCGIFSVTAHPTHIFTEPCVSVAIVDVRPQIGPDEPWCRLGVAVQGVSEGIMLSLVPRPSAIGNRQGLWHCPVCEEVRHLYTRGHGVGCRACLALRYASQNMSAPACRMAHFARRREQLEAQRQPGPRRVDYWRVVAEQRAVRQFLQRLERAATRS